MAKISYCGQVCAECPVFQATRENNQTLKLWLAFEYSSEDKQLDAAEMHCHGCQSADELVAEICQSCEIRECAKARVYISCAECEAYPCKLIERMVPVETDNRAKLEQRRETLCQHKLRFTQLQGNR